MSELNRRIGALAVATVMLIAGWYFFLHYPIANKLEPIEARISFVNGQMKKVEEMGGSISDLIDDLEDLRDSAMLLKDKMVSIQEVDSILLQIRALADSQGLEIQALAPKLSLNSFDDADTYNKESVKGLVKLPVDLRLRGDFLKFGKFMSELKSNGILYSVEDLRIRRKIDELPTLSFQVVMHLFFIENVFNTTEI